MVAPLLHPESPSDKLHACILKTPMSWHPCCQAQQGRGPCLTHQHALLPQSIIELSRTQDEEVGDGTTSVIILGEPRKWAEAIILRTCWSLVSGQLPTDALHRALIMRGVPQLEGRQTAACGPQRVWAGLVISL